LLSGAPISRERSTKVPEILVKCAISRIRRFLGHYLRSKLLHPHLRADIVVPKWRAKPWLNLMRNFRLADELAAIEHVFTCPTNDGIEGRGQDVRPTRWTTHVYVDDTDRVRFLPHNLQNPPKTYWTHSTTLVTDGRRVLLAKEDTGMV
jgi:hypothetical protein